MQWSILDCTLRDGGYYTNWDFPHSLVKKYLRTMAELPVEYVEIGYRNPIQTGYAGEYYYLPHSTLKALEVDRMAGPKLAIMLDAKNCNPAEVTHLLGDCQGVAHLIRMAVDPAKLEHGIALAKAVKQLGFEVALNLMYLSRLGDNFDILKPFQKLEGVVDYLYLVDSFGSCFPQQVRQAMQYAKQHLPQKMGFHGHANLDLAFANTLAALEAGAEMVDSTVLGMGRGAGNLRTEVIVAYLAQSLEKSIDLSSLADLLEPFQAMKDHHRWGSGLPYIVSGMADLPQKDVMEWLGKKRYSTSAVVQALQGKQLKEIESHPYPALSEQARQLGLHEIKTCIVVGGGATVTEHTQGITEFVRKQNGLIIHSSLRNVSSFQTANVRQVVCLPGREAEKLKGLSSQQLQQQFAAYILSTAPRMTTAVPSEMTMQTVEVDPISPNRRDARSSLLDQDSPLGLALSTALILGVESIYLVGFDGYPGGSEMQKELAIEVQEILDYFVTSHVEIRVRSLTPTRYNLSQQSVYALLRI